MLYDEIKPFEEEPICPNENCQGGMRLLRNSRFENLKQEILRYECPYCHYRMTITTRNNRRMDFVILGGTLAVFGAFILGVTLNLFRAIAHA